MIESLNNNREILKNKILTATVNVLKKIPDEYDEVYSFVLSPVPDFTALDIAISSRKNLIPKKLEIDNDILEFLKESPDTIKELDSIIIDPDEETEVLCCEWETFGIYKELLQDVNNYIHEIYQSFYDNGLQSKDIYSFFERILLEVINDIKTKELFQNKAFEDDILLGVQFSDISHMKMVHRISEQVNSKRWHEKILSNYISCE